MNIETLLINFENCEQAKINVEYCSIDKLFTVVLTLNDAEYARAEAQFFDDAITKLESFVNEECADQDLPV